MNKGGRDYLIKRFREEGLESYRSIVRFFERNEGELGELEFEDYFSVLLEYVDALYEIGAHYKFLRFADQVIEMSIERNIVYFEGKDIFEYFVYRKGLALLNLGLLNKSEGIALELLKMDPDNRDYKRLLCKIYYRRRTVDRINMRMYGVVFLLFSAFAVFLELAFFPVIGFEVSGFDLLRLGLFSIGLALIAVTELISSYYSRTEMLSQVKIIKQKR
ncbi:MAG: hypothetical protein EA411_08515 [Saprospirales bacterium]|nr:MAG: hypothetical protein EA411_08515 [Saprospirales bacterium]